MEFFHDTYKLNSKLSNIFIEFEEKIPHLYKLSELYIDNNNPTKKLKREFLFLRRSLGFLKSILIALFRSCFKRRTISKFDTDILFVSPYLKKSKKINFFFGDLVNDFHNLNQTIIDLRIYNGDTSISDYFNEKDDPSLNIFHLPCLSIRENLLIFKDLLRTFKDISIVVKKEKDPDKTQLLRLIRNRVFSRSNFFNFYLSAQLDNLIKSNNFQLAIVTFDGSPWERIFCKKFKSSNKRGRVAFYQHAPITKKSYFLFNKYPDLFNPDKIYCSGTIPYNIFSNKISFLKSINILGSRKHQREPKERNFYKDESVLFITQGLRKDIFTLYKIAIRLAFHKKAMKTKVLIHPAANLSIFFKAINKFFELLLPNFMCISSADDNTFSKTKFMVYFSSSLAIEKIPFDIRPIHLENSSNNNPLNELVHKGNPTLSWCSQAKNFNDILNIINSEPDLDSMNVEYSKENAKVFSKAYFEPFQLSKEIISE